MRSEDHHHKTSRERAHHQLREAGYSAGGDIKQDKKLITKAIREHENQEHDGHHSHLKLKKGGRVKGKKAEHRPDRRRRSEEHHDGREHRADGGSVGKHGGKHKGGVTVNILAGGEGGGPGAQGDGLPAAEMAHRQGIQEGAQLGARMAAARMAGAPPAGGMPPGGPRPMAAHPMPVPASPAGPPMSPRPPMPPGAGAGPGAGPMKRGGAMRDRHSGRFTGGAV